MKTICFFGDSITRRGYWLAEVYRYLVKDGVRVFNCGVSGDSASAAISRLYTDCMNHSPDTVVMMFGMNDVGRSLYDEGAVDPEPRRAERIEKYKTSIRTLSDMIRRTGTELILCTPTPYNDVTPSPLPKSSVNDGLGAMAEFIRAYAEEISVPCVDFFGALRDKVGAEYQTLPDLVHPTPESHHPMAQIFLKTLGYVKEIDPTPFLPMSEAEQALFDADQRLRELYFIEWNLMYGERKKREMTHADFIALAESRLAAAREVGDERQMKWYTYYLTNVEKKLEYEAEVMRLTLEMK